MGLENIDQVPSLRRQALHLWAFRKQPSETAPCSGFCSTVGVQMQQCCMALGFSLCRSCHPLPRSKPTSAHTMYEGAGTCEDSTADLRGHHQLTPFVRNEIFLNFVFYLVSYVP
ncbi:hypothetical protein EV356DRAFT_258519 [Viridothelium virens]|uniref:Uncharacterized protein n=1 Tax=Viridothelium virens TaxID=1048519 RepID=A0A6A6H3S9_VIRVR|nr:hypothetical protein EV356DRAFT_258519 [Viridothelium virens]